MSSIAARSVSRRRDATQKPKGSHWAPFRARIAATANTSVKVPLYVSVDVSALQYQTTRFRGPLDFLSAAGGDVAPVVEGRRPIGTPASPRNHAADPQTLRRQLVKDYYPEGKMNDFADAYRTERRSTRRAI